MTLRANPLPAPPPYPHHQQQQQQQQISQPSMDQMQVTRNTAKEDLGDVMELLMSQSDDVGRMGPPPPPPPPHHQQQHKAQQQSYSSIPSVSDVLSSFDLSDFEFPSSSLEESSQSSPSPTPTQQQPNHQQQQHQSYSMQQQQQSVLNGGMEVDDQDVADWLHNLGEMNGNNPNQMQIQVTSQQQHQQQQQTQMDQIGNPTSDPMFSHNNVLFSDEADMKHIEQFLG